MTDFKRPPCIDHDGLLDMPDTTGVNADHDARYYTETESDANFVPYTGATTDVDLGSNNIYAANLSGNTDGGFANSVYLAVQLIDGGGA